MPDNFLLESLRSRATGAANPTQLNVEITHECNLRCHHCYLEHQRDAVELSLAEWCHVFDQSVAMGCFFVAFTGGEVLCRDDFFAIVREARERGIFYHFQTNGSLVDEGVADTFRELNPTKVDVSIYGATAALHDRITGVAGSFARTLKAIELLRERYIRVEVKSTVLSLNWRDVPAMRELALQLGASFHPDPVVMPGVHGSDRPASYRMNDDEFSSYIIQEGWHLDLDDEVSLAIRELDRPELRVSCSAARSRCAVSPSGEVFPCVLWRESCGSVRRERLPEIWNGPRMRLCRDMRLDLLTYCNDCDIIDTCVRCAALAYMEEGDELSRAPESCRMSRILRGVKDDVTGIQGSEH